MRKGITDDQKEFYKKEYKEQKEPRIFNNLLYGSKEYYLSYLMPSKNKKMLCLGSGTGSKCIHLAKNGGFIIASDLVVEPLITMRDKATSEGIFAKNLLFVVADAHNLPFKKTSFDVVYGMGVLHHLDNSIAAKEIHRVVREKGFCLFSEPLGYNPIINLYRRLTPGIRTKSEVPLSRDDIRIYSSLFSKIKIRSFGFFTLILAPFIKLPPTILRIPLFFLYWLDKVIFSIFPKLKKFAWSSKLVFFKSG